MRAIMDDILKQIKRRQETADWQGDTTAGSAYLNRYDGLIKISCSRYNRWNRKMQFPVP